MSAQLIKAVFAFVGFILFPFLVIATAASALMLFDRVTRDHRNQGHHLPG